MRWIDGDSNDNVCAHSYPLFKGISFRSLVNLPPLVYLYIDRICVAIFDAYVIYLHPCTSLTHICMKTVDIA